MDNIKIGIIGTGSWGSHLVRNYFELGVLYALCDVDIKKLEILKNKYMVEKVYSNYEEIISDESINGIVISSPAIDHYKMAKKSIENKAGDFIFIGPGIAHEVFNMSDTDPVVAVVARSDASEWENIVPYERNSEENVE